MSFLYIFIAFIFGYFLATRLKKAKRNAGEQLVIENLKNNFNFESYHLINNITIPTSDGGTTQIDHVLVSPYGIFVIETKDYSGWIFGSKTNRKWTQSFPNSKFQFQNPLHQNTKHISELCKQFDFLPRDTFKSVVVFTERSEFKSRVPDNVVQLSGLVNYIRSFQTELISLNRVYFVVGKVEVLRYEESKETDQLHISYLNGKFNSKGGCRANEYT